jgi:hypothetical protein
MKLSRERYIPQGATKIADKQSDAVAYIYTNASQRPCARVFFGKQTKPVVHCYYRSEAERERAVILAFQGRRERTQRVVEGRKLRTAENKLSVGDILSTCWGYDQTNREFYEVTEVSGKFVIIREIAQAREEIGFMSGRCAPQQGQFIGQPMRKLVQWGDKVSICSFITATKWNTETVAGVKIGPALGWTSYA